MKTTDPFAEMIRSGETTLTSLAEAAGISLSAASQHLGKMRKAGFISFRRDSLTLWYRIRMRVFRSSSKLSTGSFARIASVLDALRE
jgi:DNA-binding IclR family transcriptional regulator